MLNRDFPDRVEQRAETLFRKDRLNCAETVFKALMEESGQDCPLELLRLASAFGKGMGRAGCCGSLVGGEMACPFRQNGKQWSLSPVVRGKSQRSA